MSMDELLDGDGLAFLKVGIAGDNHRLSFEETA